MDNSTIFLNINKQNYKELLNISPQNDNFYKIGFLDDGSGIVTRGKLYVTSPYFIEVVDELPSEQKDDVIYLIKE